MLKVPQDTLQRAILGVAKCKVVGLLIVMSTHPAPRPLQPLWFHKAHSPAQPDDLLEIAVPTVYMHHFAERYHYARSCHP